MKWNKDTDFIIIDDDSINNIICKKVIRTRFPEAKIIIFTNAQKGLEYIKGNYKDPVPKNALLFLDINMPGLNGWDVLEQLAEAPTEVSAPLHIYLLSSSVTPEDKIQATNDAKVLGYIEKPLTQCKLADCF
jgi:response regulator RpfG family c-di-GMP phosphodiesterase